MPDFKVITNSSQILTLAPISDGWKPATKFNSAGHIIRGYQLISKMECPYALSSRVGRTCLGLIILAAPFACFGVVTATIASGCLFAFKCVRSLITKENQAVRFAVKTNLPDTATLQNQQKTDPLWNQLQRQIDEGSARFLADLNRLSELRKKSLSQEILGATSEVINALEAEIKKLEKETEAQSKKNYENNLKLLEAIGAKMGVRV